MCKKSTTFNEVSIFTFMQQKEQMKKKCSTFKIRCMETVKTSADDFMWNGYAKIV